MSETTEWRLPNELIVEILRWCEPPTIATARQVNKTWNKTINKYDRVLWRNIVSEYVNDEELKGYDNNQHAKRDFSWKFLAMEKSGFAKIYEDRLTKLVDELWKKFTWIAHFIVFLWALISAFAFQFQLFEFEDNNITEIQQFTYNGAVFIGIMLSLYVKYLLLKRFGDQPGTRKWQLMFPVDQFINSATANGYRKIAPNIYVRLNVQFFILLELYFITNNRFLFYSLISFHIGWAFFGSITSTMKTKVFIRIFGFLAALIMYGIHSYLLPENMKIIIMWVLMGSFIPYTYFIVPQSFMKKNFTPPPPPPVFNRGAVLAEILTMGLLLPIISCLFTSLSLYDSYATLDNWRYALEKGRNSNIARGALTALVTVIPLYFINMKSDMLFGLLSNSLYGIAFGMYGTWWLIACYDFLIELNLIQLHF